MTNAQMENSITLRSKIKDEDLQLQFSIISQQRRDQGGGTQIKQN